MKKTLNNICSKAIGKAVKGVGIFTVNSTCFIGLGQIREPKNLAKYKKIGEKEN